jgi:hypothetical protein
MKTDRTFRLQPIAILGIALLAVAAIGLCITASRPSAADRRAGLTRDLAAGKLGTPQAFEARCGGAKFHDATGTGITLHYMPSDVLVSFPGAVPAFNQQIAVKAPDGRWHSENRPVGADFAFDELGCK